MVFWSMSLITWVILTVFSEPSEISTSMVTAMSLVIGLLATVIGFYNYQRRMDQQETEDVSNLDGD